METKIESQKKRREIDNPYEIWMGEGFEYRVLKKYQTPEKEADNPYARWYVAGKSPFTFGSWEYGDMYISEIKTNTERIK